MKRCKCVKVSPGISIFANGVVSLLGGWSCSFVLQSNWTQCLDRFTRGNRHSFYKALCGVVCSWEMHHSRRRGVCVYVNLYGKGESRSWKRWEMSVWNAQKSCGIGKKSFDILLKCFHRIWNSSTKRGTVWRMWERCFEAFVHLHKDVVVWLYNDEVKCMKN